MKLISILDEEKSSQTYGSYVDLPTPSEYEVTPNEDSYSQRNVLRDLYKRRLAVKRTIKLSWNAVTPEEKDTILRLTYGDAVTGGFRVQYFDPQATANARYTDTSGARTGSSQWLNAKFYRGNDLAVGPLVRWDADGEEFIAYTIQMTLGEF